MTVKIAKSRWYITTRQWPTEHIRHVLPQHGAFDTKAEAGDIASMLGPEFHAMPVKGERILKNRELFFVPHK